MAFVFRLCVIVGLAAASCAAGAITLVFRYDDYSTNSPLDIDLKVMEAFRSRNLPITFAVIPAVRVEQHKGTNLPLTPERTKILKQALAGGRFEVALHGYSHRNRLTTGRQKSEFVGLPGPEQEKLLRQGREILESGLGIPIRTFVPPWNSFDDQTLAALERLGFTTMSAGRDYTPGGQSPLWFVPGNCELTDLKRTITRAREFGDTKTIAVVIIHPYDFKEHSSKRDPGGLTTLNELSQLLDWVKAQPDLETRTLGEAGQADATLTAARCRRWHAESAAAHFLPPFLRRPLYLSENGFDQVAMHRMRLLALIYAMLFFGPFILAVLWARLCPVRFRQPAVLGILTTLGLGSATYIIFQHGWPVEWSWERLAVPSAIVGAMIGGWGQWVLLKKTQV